MFWIRIHIFWGTRLRLTESNPREKKTRIRTNNNPKQKSCVSGSGIDRIIIFGDLGTENIFFRQLCPLLLFSNIKKFLKLKKNNHQKLSWLRVFEIRPEYAVYLLQLIS